ncbi:unnamed protein product [Vicia faba]|uniref:Uncharacterized protein n=1 Tax=Vicia faba TaxID=3906 RepID=A0AAV0YRL4_VICFA|nr:unnamed protein product [Vicia faba]
MLELWLNKSKESQEVKNSISVVEPADGTDSKKILIKNLNLERIKKINAIVKDLMNLDVSDFESDEDLENCMDSLMDEDQRPLDGILLALV